VTAKNPRLPATAGGWKPAQNSRARPLIKTEPMLQNRATPPGGSANATMGG